MRKAPRIGNLEAEILDFVTKSDPVTVGEIALSFGSEKGYARTTIQTVMERLRKKGILKRDLINGVFHYSPESSRTEIQSGLVGDFVSRVLGGEILPIVQYLSKTRNLSEEESKILQHLIDSMEKSDDR
jgi:BlaI family transcriptional regulator, penicillinase repressor